MRLADYILENREPILEEWEAFARTCVPSGGTMDVAALRDHANDMLTMIAADLRTAQSGKEQSDKSRGLAADTGSHAMTAAEEHGSGRAVSGFTVEQLVAEFRALRASVIRLWTAGEDVLVATSIDDLMRFNEAIDQALAESVTHFTHDLDHSKEMFLAILGHDLRTPLGAIMTSSKFMTDDQELQEPHRTLAFRIHSSATRMAHMIGDLLDFTRSTLGGGIPIAPDPMSIEKVVRDIVDEVAAAYPNRAVNVDVRGTQKGQWDRARISQALANLIGNAFDHGAPDTTVSVDIVGDEDKVTIAIHNEGPPIPTEQLNGIFNPMKSRSASERGTGPWGGLGLGLYIAERIVNAHDGRIDVESSQESGTTFSVHLPRRA